MLDHNPHLLNQFLRGLSPALFDKVRPRLRTCNHAAGEVLFRAGDKITNVHFWQTGAVSLVLELAPAK
jgi:hypothetical protein